MLCYPSQHHHLSLHVIQAKCDGEGIFLYMYAACWCMLSGGFCNTHHNGDTVLMVMMVIMVMMVMMVMMMMMVNLIIFICSCHPLFMSGY